MTKKRASIIGFFQEVRVELAKVVWPNRAQVIRLTTIVVIVSVAIAVYIGLLDSVFTKLIGILLVR